MKTLYLTLCFLLLTVPVFGADDVPPSAKDEIGRRGNMVKITGQYAVKETDILTEALAPPADDSDKWYICLVKGPNCAPCERLYKDFCVNPELRFWVHPENPKDSPCHFTVRYGNDDTQMSYFKDIRKEIDKLGYPCLVLQPPANGKYGPSKTVIGFIAGYDGNAKLVSDKIRDLITQYVTKYQADHRALFTQKAPFDVLPKNPIQVTPGTEIIKTFPELPLSLAQIRQIVPTAPDKFVLEQLTQQVTSIAQVLKNYEVYKQPNPPLVQPENPVAPVVKPSVVNSSLYWITITGILLTIVTNSLVFYRQYRKETGKNLFFTDQQFSDLLIKIKEVTNAKGQS